jgi:serine/threonine protein kinase
MRCCALNCRLTTITFRRSSSEFAPASTPSRVIARPVVGTLNIIFYKYSIDIKVLLFCSDLIRRCICVDPLARITIAEIRQHEWFQIDLPT